MFRIVRNECLRQVRLLVSRSDEAPAGPEASAEPSAEDTVLHRLEVERIAAAVSALPRDQRQVLIMRDVQGLPGRTVAHSLGLSNAAMKSRLHRARAALRHSLTLTGQTPGQAAGQAPDQAIDQPVAGDSRP
jgi:RNA polymerase sigma-70 factor (ECF subfamily)